MNRIDEPGAPAADAAAGGVSLSQWMLVAAFWGAVVVTAIFAFGPSPDGSVPGRDKVYHVLTFLTLGLLGSFAFPRTDLTRLALLLLAGGVLIELIQGLPIVGRDRSLGDVVADAVGVAGAMLAAAGVRRLAWRR